MTHDEKDPKHWLKPLKREFKNMSNGCLNCGFIDIKLKMNWKPFQGFGGEHIEKDGKTFYMPETWRDGSIEDSYKKNKTLMWVELRARKSPNSDWRVISNHPLHSEEYQRQGKNNWVMVKKERGFA